MVENGVLKNPLPREVRFNLWLNLNSRGKRKRVVAIRLPYCRPSGTNFLTLAHSNHFFRTLLTYGVYSLFRFSDSGPILLLTHFIIISRVFGGAMSRLWMHPKAKRPDTQVRASLNFSHTGDIFSILRRSVRSLFSTTTLDFLNAIWVASASGENCSDDLSWTLIFLLNTAGFPV